MTDPECVAFLQWALPRLRLRWPGFRKVRRQVRKRLARRLAALGLATLGDYRARLEADPQEWRVLNGLCRITISRFCRDRGLFESLANAVLPELARAAAAQRRAVRCWCAGCASGEEVYSLRMLWDLDGPAEAEAVGFEVIGSDLDEALLERARQGCYQSGSLKEVPAHWLARSFEQRDGLHCVRAAHRRGVGFLCQDLRSELPLGPFDLVLCRNLAFTYFAADLQGEVLHRICGEIRCGGFLAVGGHETLPPGHGLEPLPGCRCIYRKNLSIDR